MKEYQLEIRGVFEVLYLDQAIIRMLNIGRYDNFSDLLVELISEYKRFYKCDVYNYCYDIFYELHENRGWQDFSCWSCPILMRQLEVEDLISKLKNRENITTRHVKPIISCIALSSDARFLEQEKNIMQFGKLLLSGPNLLAQDSIH